MPNRSNKFATFSITVVIVLLIAAVGLVVRRAAIESTPASPGGAGAAPPSHNISGDEVKDFRITLPPSAKVGETVNISITAMDNNGSPVSNYTGQVFIRSELLDLPQKSRYLPGDVGRHQFRAKALKPGAETIEVFDPVSGVRAKSERIVILDSEQ